MRILDAAPRRARLARLLALCLTTAALLSGCGLRLETPPPAEPTPDAAEQSRRDGVELAGGIETTARAAAAEDTPPAVAALLLEIADAAAEHSRQLGGAYVSGLGTTEPEPEGAGPDDGAPGAAPGTGDAAQDDTAQDDIAPSGGSATPDDVLESLVEGYRQTRESLPEVPDPGLARLRASMAVGYLDLSRRLAVELTLPVPDPGGEQLLPPTVPAVEGIPAGTVAELIVAEDAAGYGYEVVAARSTDPDRAAATQRARTHRDRAQAWLDLASGGSGSTVADPRRAAYALPDDLPAEGADRVLAQRLETRLAQNHAALLGSVAAEDRLVTLDLLADAWLAARSWGAAGTALPGL